MTKVIYNRTAAGSLYFEIENHAGGEACVVITTAVNVLVLLMDKYGIPPYAYEEGRVKYEIERSSEEIGMIFEAVMELIKQAEEQYPGRIKVY